MNWRDAKIGYDKSQELFVSYYLTGEPIECPRGFEELQNSVCELYDSCVNQAHRPSEYRIDSNFGLAFYILTKERYGLDTRYAGNPGLWRFLSLLVLPRIVRDRCGIEHPDKVFGKKKCRLWLYVIWWFSHLSWQGNKEDTARVMDGLTTDFILQLVDRIGENGYRLQLCRNIMKAVHENRLSNEQFRKLMVLNTAWLQSIEPALFANGETGYVESLIRCVAQQN